jgi:two-component system response regulator TctD
MRILIVEDDAALARGLSAALRQSGLEVDHVVDGRDAVQLAASEPYRVVVLDLGLPGLPGLEVLQCIRAAGSLVPVIILTARDAVTDRIRGLDLGADDYLPKPFDLQEFEARVRALIRRGLNQPNPVQHCGALALDRSAGAASVAGRRLPLRRREYAILDALMTRVGKVVSKERLSAEVFGIDTPVAPNAVELYVARLRRKLEGGGPRIRTIHGLGYLLECVEAGAAEPRPD